MSQHRGFARAAKLSILGVLVAIAISTAMDAAGLFMFSALPLFPLMVLLWSLERLSRREMGLVGGRWRHYGLALLHPVLVLGLLAVIAAGTGAIDVSRTDWRKAGLNTALIVVSTILMALVTEEGFFRGWLWASLRRTGLTQRSVLAWTSVAFALWHLSAVALDTAFRLPARQIPIFMVNAAVLGAAWGLMRSISGSIVVASFSHAVWNGITYSLFGYGTKVGALGIENTALFGPEVGLVGLALNVVFVVVLGSLELPLGRGVARITGRKN